MRYWSAGEQERLQNIARATLIRFQPDCHEDDDLRHAFNILREHGKPHPPRRRIHGQHGTKRDMSLTSRIRKHIRKGRRLGSFYVPVSPVALALLVVPSIVLCLFVWLRLALVAGRCGPPGANDGGNAPCMVPSYVSCG